MKKTISIILAILFLAGSFRVGVAAHYCGGKIAQVKFGLGNVIAACGMEEGKTSCDGENIASSCCKDKVQQLSLNDSFWEATSNIIHFPDFLIQFYYNIFSLFISIDSLLDFNINYKPPQGSYNAVNLPSIRVFRI